MGGGSDRPGLRLAHHGVRFRLFAKRTEPPKYSKAKNLWGPPQELLAGVGGRKALVEGSYRVSDVNVVITVRACSATSGTSPAGKLPAPDAPCA